MSYHHLTLEKMKYKDTRKKSFMYHKQEKKEETETHNLNNFEMTRIMFWKSHSTNSVQIFFNNLKTLLETN